MAKDKAPAFQWYPKDFETDEVAACMTLAERGVYITLLGYCWLEGSIPNDEHKLARLCRCTDAEFKKSWETVSQKFVGTDRLINPRLEKERVSQREHSERRKSASQTGNAKRWGIAIGVRNGSQTDPNRNPNRIDLGIPIDRSSSSSPKEETKNVSSSPDDTLNRILKRHPKKSGPNYAATEFVKILSESQDQERMAMLIDESHVRWCRHWEETGTKPQFVSKLADWFAGGDWKVDPPADPDASPQYPKPLM